MRILIAIRTAVSSLSVNKTRSFLASLGIVIGAFAVTVMSIMGNGAKEKLDERLESVGKRLIVIRPTDTSLMPADMEALRKDQKLGQLVSGLAEAQSFLATVAYNRTEITTTVDGAHHSVFRLRNWKLQSGRLLAMSDSKRFTCVIGKTVCDRLFRYKSPIGSLIKINNISYTVVGLLKSRGYDPLGRDHDDVIFIHLDTAKSILNQQYLTIAIADAMSEDKIVEAEARITAVMRASHKIPKGMPDDFKIDSVSSMSEFGVIMLNVMNLLTIAISFISLIVGGIGVANIMLISVKERIPEIGIRMAIGARTGDVLWQFLIESILLTLVGGVSGVVLGAGLSICALMILEWPIVIPMAFPICAFIVLMLIGVVFGLYAAILASRLEPVEAIRTV